MAVLASCPVRLLLSEKGGKQSFAHEMNHGHLSTILYGMLDGRKGSLADPSLLYGACENPTSVDAGTADADHDQRR